MIQGAHSVERRRGRELGRRSEVWPEWRRRLRLCPRCLLWCQFVAMAVICMGAGALVGWILSHNWHWVEWKNVTITHTIGPNGHSELVLDLEWDLKVECDRLRLIPPWSLVAYYPERNVAVAMPRQPSDELMTRAEAGSGRVIISLSQRLDPNVRHEISVGLSCLQDANGGTVHDAEVEVVVKGFTP